MAGRHSGEESQELDLAQAAQTLLDECRMVLPGIQALFGFQLIAVFSERFSSELDKGDQVLHLVAIALVAIAVALVMTPAAYHRHRGARKVTDTFIELSTLLLLTSMVPLAAGLSIDFFLIARTDALSTNPTFFSATVNDPRDPLVVGCAPPACNVSETTRVDYIGVDIGPDGTPWAGYADSCTATCAKKHDAGTPPVGLVGYMVDGPNLNR